MNSTSGKDAPRGALPPIAIVGIGCRFPGKANSPRQFWALLQAGVDAVGEIIPERWDAGRWFHPEPSCPGRIYTRAAGCVEQHDEFDADFFGISPREAATMDPQQRVLLEVAWETIEDAGVTPDQLAGSRTGVFVGICAQEYATLQSRDPLRMTGTSNTGGASSIAANRISYQFDLRGPSYAVDTACSSSLVALDAACKTIWHGEASMALAGGVSLLLTPEMSVGFAKARMLSPTGRCRPFDAAADGYVRGEGAGMILLKPLEQAIADGDRVYAVIRATGVNQDGHSSGLTVPNGKAQAALIREVLDFAGIRPEEVQFVEAHGTGTPVGDPIECTALGEVLGAERPDGGFCRIGSVKSNIGHLEGASGIAGLIKVALALHHRMLPANLHFESPNPNIPLDQLNLRVQQALEPWPEGPTHRTAGVNSFGFGGTNAHALLQEYVAPQDEPPGDRTPAERTEILVLSARSRESLESLARRYQQVLDQDETELIDLCRAAVLSRATHPYRLAAIGSTSDEMSEAIGAYLAGQRHPGLVAPSRAAQSGPKIGFVFSGNGPQWWGMARQLLTTEPVFRETVERCDRELKRYDRWSLLDELQRDEASSRMHLTEIAQPALFAIQLGLVDVLGTWGIEPAVVFGHSVGEVAAAKVAGILDFEAAVRVIYHRSDTQAKTAGSGAMAAVNLTAEQVQRLLDRYNGRLTIAAVNSRDGVTVSGDKDVLDRLLADLEDREVYCQKLRLDYAFHSHHMDPVQDELLGALADVTMHPPVIRFVSTVTGQEVTDGSLSSNYWWDNVRKPVQFARACERVVEEQFDAIVEIGPHPVVSSYVAESFAAKGKSAAVLPSLRRYVDDRATLLTSVGTLHAMGQPVQWNSIYPRRHRWVDLPTYPWNRERYWNIAEETRQTHPLLGTPANRQEHVWQQHVNLRFLAYLCDHRFEGSAVFPAAGFVEMALAAGRVVFGTDRIDLDQLDIHRALSLPEDASSAMELQLATDGTFRISARPLRDDSDWTCHASGKIRPLQSPDPPPTDLQSRVASLTGARSPLELYQQAAARGLEYGPSVQGVRQIWSGPGEAFAEVRVTPGNETDAAEYQIHPTLLDACFQTVFGLLENDHAEEPSGWLPVRIGRFRLFRQAGQRANCHVSNVTRSDRFLAVDACIVDESGQPIAWIERLCFQEVRLGRVRDDQLQYVLEWVRDTRDPDAARAARYFPTLDALAEQISRDGSETREDECDDISQLDALSSAFFRSALAEFAPSQRFTIDQLVRPGGIQPRFRGLVHRFLERLQAAGDAIREGDEWELVGQSDSETPARLWQDVATRLPDFHADLLSIGRSGKAIAAMLRGEVDPRDGVFPKEVNKSFPLLECSPVWRKRNRTLQEACRQLLASLPDDQPARILVTGAATSGIASHLLASLSGRRATCTLADTSEEARKWLEDRFRRYGFVDFVTFDPADDQATPEFAAEPFDLIVCVRSLWAVDLTQPLARVSHLLADGGLLLFEQPGLLSTTHELIFGPLLCDAQQERLDNSVGEEDGPRWLDPFHRAGFVEVTALGPSDAAGTQLLVARRGTRPAERRDHGIPSARESAAAGTAASAQDNGDAAHAKSQARGSWLIFSDRQGVAERLADALRSENEDVHVVYPGDAFDCQVPGQYTLDACRKDDFLTLLQTMQFKSEQLSGIVYLWGLEIPDSEDPRAFHDSVDACTGIVHLVQALDETGQACKRLWIVTGHSGASEDEGASATLFQSPLWGLGRVVRNERPHLKCTLVALPAAGDGAGSGLRDELRRNDAECEILRRDGKRYVRRLRPLAESLGRVSPNDDEAFRLELDRVGQFQSFAYRRIPRTIPGPGEVEIEVAAAGLNFKDVMWAMGMLPGEVMSGSFAGPCFGFECSGVVSAVGSGVTDLRIGDEVMAFAPHAFGRYATTVTQAVCRKPQGVSFSSAATVPVAFLTAEYALAHLARVQPGERVLIHGGAGGVGMAAIQIVRSLGGIPLVTAGSEEKRDYLARLGVEHVFDSRSLAFGDAVMAATGGEGVDVVLNSLAGDAMDRSLALLRPFGRFLEIGKRDFVENSRLRMRPLENNVSYFAIDADQLLKYQPHVAQAVLQSVMAKFADGRYHPLPHVVFSASDVADAFRYMQRSQHIGKVVVSMSSTEVAIRPRRNGPIAFRRDGSYLIVGGLGGIGRALARWFAENGAGQLILAGRSQPRDEAKKEIDRLRELGAEVQLLQVDVNDRPALEAMLGAIRETMPPLRGVVHAAMVLDDAGIGNLDRPRMESVMGCKTLGAWNLHCLTRDDPLDHFVLFSSFSSVMGNPGQANYAAANAFLDGLAAYRKHLGLPALAINWGLFGQVGYAAEQSELVERFSRIGVHALAPPQAFRILGKLSAEPAHEQVAVCNLQWGKWRQLVKQSASPVWSHLAAHSAGGQDAGDESFHDRLAMTPEKDWPELFRKQLARHLAAVLATAEERLDGDRPISELGLDSLMAVELKSKIEADMGVELSMMKLFAGETISSLARSLAQTFQAETPAAQDAATTPESHVRHPTALPVGS